MTHDLAKKPHRQHRPGCRYCHDRRDCRDTQALRNLTDEKSARLVWWNDEDWPDDGRAGAWDDCKVLVDGPALKSLREATGIA